MKNIYVVTGGSGGIGLEAAKQLKDGIVIIADINEEALKSGKVQLESMGIETRTAICDVTSKENVAALAKEADSLGTIKAVVHTAGVSGTVSNTNLVMKVDLIGTAHIIEEFLPYMGKDSAALVVASMMGYVIPPNPKYDELMVNCLEDDFLDNIAPFLDNNPDKAYNFAKRGVQLLAEKWAIKYGEKGARINSISPGIIETPMTVDAAKEHPEQMAYMESITPLKRNGKPQDIANIVSFLLSEEASFITGSDIRIDGGLVKNLISMESKKQ
ncbi:MAG: SDR family oxidoreductase [Clostridiales bacterium]